jgi:hypothetical protein
MGSSGCPEQRDHRGTGLACVQSVRTHGQINIRTGSLSQPFPGLSQSPMELFDPWSAHGDLNRSGMDSTMLEHQMPSTLANKAGCQQ